MNVKRMLVLEELESFTKNDEMLKEVSFFLEDEHIIRMSLEYTFYDYDYEPADLINLLKEKELDYDWYNSCEIHIYVREEL